MTCPHCTGEDGEALMPSYGPAPHVCYYKIPGAVIGQSEELPRDTWLANFKEDPDAPGLGTYWCPHCGEGEP